MAGRNVADFIRQTGRTTGQGVKSTGRYIKEASGVKPNSVDSMIMAAPRLVGTAAADATFGVGKRVNKMMPFTNRMEQNIGNLYTGRTEGPGMIVAAGAIGLGYTAFQKEKQTTFSHKLGVASYGGSAPIMNSDGVGQTTNAPTLGASGSTVFGLHNARKG